MYNYTIKGIERTCYTDKDIKEIEARRRLRAKAKKESDESIKLLNECMKSDTHNCKFCN